MPSFLCGPNLTSIHYYWKNHTLTIWTSVRNVMSLLFSTLSMFVIVSNKEQTSFHFMIAVTICSDLEPKKKKSVAISIFFPFYLPWSDWTECVILVFWCWVLNQLYHSPLSPSSRGSSLFSAIRGISSACLRLLIFLPKIWFKPVIHPSQHFAWCTLHVS